MHLKQMLKFITTFGIMFSCVSLFAATDLTSDYLQHYNQSRSLSYKEQQTLKAYDIYYIPGILAESFIGGDDRSSIHFDYLTKDYFGHQVDLLNQKYKIPAKRLSTSSHDIRETRSHINLAVTNAAKHGRKVLFISHSLGGLVLLEEILENPSLQNHIAGIAFMQSPFYGSPLSEIALNPNYGLKKIISPLLPYVNLSEETILYVGVKARTQYMEAHTQQIDELVKTVPLFTFSTSSKSNQSFLKPLIDIIESGCLKSFTGRCVTDVFYEGPYDKNDGLIPFKSSFLENADYITLDDVDHIEPILKIPFESYDKEHVTTSILRILLEKVAQ